MGPGWNSNAGIGQQRSTLPAIPRTLHEPERRPMTASPSVGTHVPGAYDDSVSDASVVERSWAEPDVFAVLFNRYADDIHRYAARRLGRRGGRRPDGRDLRDRLPAATRLRPL